MLHPEMGPGGVLTRNAGDAAWNGPDGASAWGPEGLEAFDKVLTGKTADGAWPFRGDGLQASMASPS